MHIFKVPCTKNKRFGPERTSQNENVLEVVLGGKIYPGFLTLDGPEDQSRFFRIRNGLPTSFGQVEFMPVAFNPIEAYGKRWYGLVLLPCQGPNCYR